MMPPPVIVPPERFVNAAEPRFSMALLPAPEPPTRLTTPKFVRAPLPRRLSVPPPLMVAVPSRTILLANERVLLVTNIVPRSTTTFETVPYPIRMPLAALVRLLPTIKPLANETVPLLDQFVLPVTVWFPTFIVPFINGAMLLIVRPPPPLRLIVALLARVNPPATLATALVIFIVEFWITNTLVVVLLMITLPTVEFPAIVPALLALMFVAVSVPVNPSVPLMIRKLFSEPWPLKRRLLPWDVPANVSVALFPLLPAVLPTKFIAPNVTLLEKPSDVLAAFPDVPPVKFTCATPLVKKAEPLNDTVSVPA